MLTRLETMVNQTHAIVPPASLTRLRSLSLNILSDMAPGLPTGFLEASVTAMPACMTTLRLALWSTIPDADLSSLTQLKVTHQPVSYLMNLTTYNVLPHACIALLTDSAAS